MARVGVCVENCPGLWTRFLAFHWQLSIVLGVLEFRYVVIVFFSSVFQVVTLPMFTLLF